MKTLSHSLLVLFVSACAVHLSIAQCPVIDSPTITVIDNTCSPVMDGSYVAENCTTGILEYSVDNGLTWSLVQPAYPTSFTARCFDEGMCMMVEADFMPLNGSTDAVVAVNNATPAIMVGSAILTLDAPIYNGTAIADEEEINASQTTGAVGIKFGVGAAIGPANNMMNGYNLSESVCNVSFIIWDIDQTDEMVLNLSNGGNAVTYSVTPLDPMTCVTQSGNTFTTIASAACQVQAPNTNLAVRHAVMITADDCIDAIDITYYDNGTMLGNGGSYTISNIQGEACREDCVSPVTTVTASPVTCMAAIEIVKSPGDMDPADMQTILLNETAEFSITVTNTGNVTLNNVTVTDPEAPMCALVIATLAPMESQTYTCSLENVTMGFINMAFVTGDPEDGSPQVMDSDQTSVIVLAPGISIMKSALDGMDVQTVPIGGTATFEIVVMNTGNTVLNNVIISDPLAPDCDMVFAQLLPGTMEVYTCTDPDFDGSYTNEVNVTADPDGGGVQLEDMDQSQVIVESSPGIEIEKTAIDGSDTQIVPEGGAAQFNITVTNTGDIALNDVVVSDPLSPACDMTIATLPVLGSVTYSCSISNVSADFTNAASATGNPTDGSPPASDSDVSEVVVDICDLPAPALSVTDKTCNPLVGGSIVVSSGCPVGSMLEYSMDGINWSTAMPVYNNNVAISIMTRCIEMGTGADVCTVTSSADFSDLEGSSDPVVAFLTADPPVMVGGATMTLGTSITAGSAFVDEESINNSQTTGDIGIRFGVQNSDGPSNNMMNFYNFSQPVCDLGVTIWDIDQTDVMILEAFNGATPVSYTTSNLGSCVNQSGNMFTPDGPACQIQINQLPEHAFDVLFDDCVTQIKVTYYDTGAGSGGSYTVSNFETQDCIPADCISPVSTVTTAPEQCNASIAIVKTAPDGTDTQSVSIGTPAGFSITVTNTGNITLDNVEVSDPASPACDNMIGTLTPGQTFTYTCSSADVTADFTNTADVVGSPEDGSMNATDSDPSEVVVLFPAITIDKTAIDGSDSQQIVAGGTATFEITVTNTGPVTLNNVVVSDPLSPDCNTTIGTLGAGEDRMYTCTIDNVTSDFTNVASASGEPDGGGPVVTDMDPTEVEIFTNGAITIAKTAADGSDSQQVLSGGTATFEITVSNTGNVDLINVAVSDPLSPSCDTVVSFLAIGEDFSYTCTIDNVTADFTNVANVVATPNNDTPAIMNSDPTEVVVQLIPAVEIDKTAADGTDNQQVVSGGTATFEITVSNTGDVDLTNVVVSDPLSPSCDTVVSFLAIGEIFSYTCTIDNVTADFTNVANVVATPNNDTPAIMDSDPTEVDVSNPCISITKSSAINLGANGTGDPGDIVTYTYESCNCGDVTLTNVTVTESAALFTGTGTLPIPGPTTPSTLAPGECGIATATYILTQSDIVSGSLVNQAVVSGTPPSGPDIIDNSDSSNPNDPGETGGPDDPTTTIIPVRCPALVCNVGLQISVGLECFVALTPDMLLEGAYGDDSNYTIEATDENGTLIGDTLTAAQIGQTLTYKVISKCSQNSCWGEIIFESNILPNLSTVCDYVAGDMHMQDGTISNSGDAPVKLTVDKTDACQEMLLIESFTNLKYNSGTLSKPIWSLGTVSWELTSGAAVISSGTLTSEGDSDMIDISTLPNGSYMVTFTSDVAMAKGNYKYKISVPSCEVDPACAGWCGAGEPEAFITLKEATDLINNGCAATIIGDIIATESESGKMCDPNGVIKVVTYTAVIEMHGERSKVILATQAYSQEKLDIRPGAGNTEILFPRNLEVDCDTDIDVDASLLFGSPEYIEALTGSGAAAYPSFIDLHSPVVPDTIFRDKITHKDSIVGTREQMVLQEVVFKDGTSSVEWVLLTVVDKVFVEVKEPDTIIPGTFSRPLVPIREGLCNLLVTYDDLKFSACAGGEKIVREWVIIDWCDSSVRETGIQNIEISDQTAPIVKTPSAKLVSTDPWTCSAKVKLPDLEIVDNCSSEFDVKWSASEGTIVDGYALDLWPTGDTIQLRGLVADECGNKTEVIMPIFVSDNVPPSMVCQDRLQVTLTFDPNSEDGDGVAKVLAESFDLGTHDSGCGEVSFTVVRMEDWSETVTDCAGNFLGYRPQSCSPITETVDLGGPAGKNNCIYDNENLGDITVAGDFVKFCCEDVGEDVMVMLIATDTNGNVNFCMVSVNVVNKAVATMICEPVTIECAGEMADMPGPRMIGGACEGGVDVQLLEELSTNGSCGAGTIIRKYYVDADGDGDVSSGDPYCEQIITIEAGSGAFDPSTIKWPKHHDGTVVTGVNLECNPDAKEGDDPITVFENINIPMGDVAICIPDEMGDSPSWCDTDCGLIGYNVNVDTVFVSDACLKIIKRWTIIDWCVWESNAEDVDDENDTANDTFEAVEDWAQGECVDCDSGHGPVHPDPVYFRYRTYDADGYYTYDQLIKVVDDSAPTIEGPAEYTVNTSGGASSKDDSTACTGNEAITASAQDFCGGIASGSSKLTWVITVTKDGELVTSKTETGATATMNSQTGSPGDVHLITWTVKDGCGNTATSTTTVTFGDEKAPTPLCISGLTTAFMQDNGTIAVWGKEFDFGSFDNCTSVEDLRFSLVPEDEVPIRPGEEGFEDQNGITFRCDEFSSFRSLDVWVWDATGNGDFCNVNLGLGDNGNVCPEGPGDVDESGSSAMIAGQVTTEAGEMIDNTQITINSALPEYPKSQMNNATDGSYAFENVVMGSDYRIMAERDGDDLNGVSTLDLVVISRHILDINSLDSPYKVIAADANADFNVSTIDLVVLKRMILGVTNEFFNTNSWVFLDKEFNFVQEMSPWPFVDSRLVMNLDRAMMQENFIGVKIGDVNASVKASDLQRAETRSIGTLSLDIEDQQINKGEVVTIAISAKDFKEYFGMQFTLDHSGLRLVDIDAAALDMDENSIGIHEESLTMSWFAEEAVSHQGELFNLTFEAEKDLRLSESFIINSSITPAEAYQGDDFDHHNVLLTFSDQDVTKAKLDQNTPNPFDEKTQIGFSIPVDGVVTLTIIDVSGKVVNKTSDTYKAGHHVVTIDQSMLHDQGVYYYQLDSGSYTATKKMVLIK